MPCCFRSRISGRRSVARRREHTQVTQGALRCRLTAAPFRRSHASDDWTAITLYAASGPLIPLSANSPTRSTSTAFSIFVSTRGLIRICPGWRRRRAERRHCYKIIVLLWLGIGCCRCCNDGDAQTRSHSCGRRSRLQQARRLRRGAHACAAARATQRSDRSHHRSASRPRR